jgi:hypothetical protein
VFTKTRIALLLAAGLVIGAALFVLGPALFPRADDPVEEIAGESADSGVEAQAGGGSGTSTLCEASTSGIVHNVYADGAERFDFPDGHSVKVEALRPGEQRNVVHTYPNKTTRVQEFAPGTDVLEMPSTRPLDDRWFGPRGRPMVIPDRRVYPELWPWISYGFDYSGPSGESNPDDFWNQPGYRPPMTPDESIDVWGVPEEMWDEGTRVCHQHSNGVIVCNDVFGIGMWIVYPDGQVDRVFLRGLWRRLAPDEPLLLEQGEQVSQVGEFPPSGDPDYNRPPDSDEERQALYGDVVIFFEDDGYAVWLYADGHKYIVRTSDLAVFLIGIDGEWEYAQEPPPDWFFAPLVMVCGEEGPADATRWADGTTRVRLLPDGTTVREAIQAESRKECWYDKLGQPVEGRPSGEYPEPQITFPPQHLLDRADQAYRDFLSRPRQ